MYPWLDLVKVDCMHGKASKLSILMHASAQVAYMKTESRRRAEPEIRETGTLGDFLYLKCKVQIYCVGVHDLLWSLCCSMLLTSTFS